MNVLGIGKLYTDEDVAGSGFPYKSIRMLTDAWKDAWNDEKKGPDKPMPGDILSCIRTMSHKRMITLNSAYAHIKALYDPQEWKKLFGYEVKTVFNEREGFDNKEIFLEGDGEVTVYPNHYEYFSAGPYLHFDYGVDPDHPWTEPYHRAGMSLKHIFANKELREGKKITPALLSQLFDCFQLDAKKRDVILGALNDGGTSEDVMKVVGIPTDNELNEKYRGPKTGKLFETWQYGLRLRRQLNEITTLNSEPSWHEDAFSLFGCENTGYITMEMNGDKMTLNGYDQSNFSEADYTLFLTLAYGPMLMK